MELSRYRLRITWLPGAFWKYDDSVNISPVSEIKSQRKKKVTASENRELEDKFTVL